MSNSPRPTPKTPPILIALAGPTSSGKTTLARALLQIFSPHSPQQSSSPRPFPSLRLLHLDDYYLPDAQIPFTIIPAPSNDPNGQGQEVQDWDTPSAFDWQRWTAALADARNGVFKTGDGTTEVPAPEPTADAISEAYILKCRDTMSQSVSLDAEQGQVREVVLCEGLFPFLPSHHPLAVPGELFDEKILLRVPRNLIQARRAVRSAYVTAEGATWRDPEGYFEGVVWKRWVETWGPESDGGKGDGVVVCDVRDGKEGLEEGLLWLVMRICSLLGVGGDGAREKRGEVR